MPLTDDDILQAKPGMKPAKLFAGTGLYLLITPKGGKFWRFKYRFRGKERLLSMGRYPEVSLENARLFCVDARKLLAKGIDPSAVRKERKAKEKAHRLEAKEGLSVRIQADNKLEVVKDRAVLHLTMKEAHFLRDLLSRLCT